MDLWWQQASARHESPLALKIANSISFAFRLLHIIFPFLLSPSSFLLPSSLTVSIAGYDDTPSATLENGSSSPVNVSVWKGDKKVFVQKQVQPKETITIDISDKIFVMASESLNVGDEIQVIYKLYIIE